MALATTCPVVAPAQFHWSAYAAISGPLLILAVLLLINWIYRKELRDR